MLFLYFSCLLLKLPADASSTVHAAF